MLEQRELERLKIRTKPSESTDTSFGGRIKKDLWTEFKAICDDSQVMTSSVLIQYIKACVRQKSLITFAESDEIDETIFNSVYDKLDQIEKRLSRLEQQNTSRFSDFVSASIESINQELQKIV